MMWIGARLYELFECERPFLQGSADEGTEDSHVCRSIQTALSVVQQRDICCRSPELSGLTPRTKPGCSRFEDWRKRNAGAGSYGGFVDSPNRPKETWRSAKPFGERRLCVPRSQALPLRLRSNTVTAERRWAPCYRAHYVPGLFHSVPRCKPLSGQRLAWPCFETNVNLFARLHPQHNRDALEDWNQVKCSLRGQRFEALGSFGADDQGATWLKDLNDLGIGAVMEDAQLALRAHLQSANC